VQYDQKFILVFSSDSNENIFLCRFSNNTQILNFMKIRTLGAELFHADGRTDRHDEANIASRNRP